MIRVFRSGDDRDKLGVLFIGKKVGKKFGQRVFHTSPSYQNFSLLRSLALPLYWIYMIFFVFIFGLCIGSFLNVLAQRLPKKEDVIGSRSHCDFCSHTLCWYELIPLISFVLQKGKSRCCHHRLSFRYPLTELATGIGFVLVYSYQLSAVSYQMSEAPFVILFVSALILFSSLFIIFLSDLEYEIIPIQMIIIGFLAACVQLLILSPSIHSIFSHILSGLGAGLFFFALWFFTKGKAMGDGDMYLGALIGFLLGYPKIIVSLYGAFLTGAIVGIILILGWKRSLKAHIPFGPFLILGYTISLLWGDAILRIWRVVW